MSIKFVCSCGKRLRARDAMAARRSICPRCGAPVGIPSLTPTHPETPVGPLTPAQRVREQMRRLLREARPPDGQAPAFGIGPAPPPPRPVGVLQVEPAVQPAGNRESPAPTNETGSVPRFVRRSKRHYCSRCHGYIESHWYECLLYPLRALLFVLQLAVALTVSTTAILFFLPLLLERFVQPGERFFYCLLPCLLVEVAVTGYVCAFLDLTLEAAASGHARHVAWPGRDAIQIVKAPVAWLVCFLAGPVVLAAIAGWYWFHCGDPNGLDWFILGELGVVAVGYWLLALLAVHRHGRLRDANPLRVAELLERLGPRSLIAALIASAIFLGHGFAAVSAFSEIHRNAAGAVLVLSACSFSSLFSATFLFRLLGVWCHLAIAR
jgi:hypothetical protein